MNNKYNQRQHRNYIIINHKKYTIDFTINEKDEQFYYFLTKKERSNDEIVKHMILNRINDKKVGNTIGKREITYFIKTFVHENNYLDGIYEYNDYSTDYFVSMLGKYYTKMLFNRAYDKINASLKIMNDFVDNNLECLHEQISESLRIVDNLCKTYKQQNKIYTEWANLGWSQIPDCIEDDEEYMMIEPKLIEKPDDYMEKLYDKVNIEKIFNYLIRKDLNNSDDLKEMYINFFNGQYKSCAMLTFSLIDAFFIKFNKFDCVNYKKQSKNAVGKKAIYSISSKLEGSNSIEFYSGVIIGCILKTAVNFFDYGDFFNDTPTLCNRNFLIHGMLNRKVTRKDCLQLIILYTNIIDYLVLETESQDKRC